LQPQAARAAGDDRGAAAQVQQFLDAHLCSLGKQA
jgi:hypothetical protein